MNKILYILSVNYQTQSASYITEPRHHGGLFDLSMSIKDARVFDNKQDAWDWREIIDRAETWDITPISAKDLFKQRLAA